MITDDLIYKMITDDLMKMWGKNKQKLNNLIICFEKKTTKNMFSHTKEINSTTLL